MKCKWCDEKMSGAYPDNSCGKCWEFVNQLDHALHTKKLFTILKDRVAARTLQIHKDGHF